MKRGRGARPILKSDIQIAQANCKSAAQCARYLNISYNTYKKWAKQYGLFEKVKNQRGTGIRAMSKNKPIAAARERLEMILDGRRSISDKENRHRLKEVLIEHSYLEQKCAQCGFHEKRITDDKVPLMIDFIDGNKDNWVAENLQFLCLNCTFLTRGNLSGRRKSYEI